ncbi:uncharacterized protein (TIGR02596 family) [Roseimicrobium gellanilyticum]|uniref:Uncharacterized protein (TIGR02596 family) n=1 Tax=Roseimicrobium gellanilyticum TaxID=748857 RepID=A0A366HGB8_9BACT|nr:Verru_Chthon cassette protein D [Roseimicrobium gellanilyticum]RBP41251.1 uncharacterized protein (TIGR02596 family) [Roseimicrobium gellanilyticum]
MKIPVKSPLLPSIASLTRRAFTLIEMITVITVVAALMVIATPYLMETIQANRLTSAGEGLMFRIARLQQIVATTGKPGEIRFFKFENEDAEGFQAYQLFAHNESTGQLTAVENPVYLRGDNLVFLEGQLSPLLDQAAHGAASGSWPRPAADEPFKSMAAQYLRIAFYPDGSTSLVVPLRSSYLTLAAEAGTSRGMTAPPPNYYTIQIDPVTGRAKSYRP